MFVFCFAHHIWLLFFLFAVDSTAICTLFRIDLAKQIHEKRGKNPEKNNNQKVDGFVELNILLSVLRM